MTLPGGTGERRQFTPDFLTELFRNPLDPGYAAAAARRAKEGPAPRRTRALASAATALTTLVLGFVLVVVYRQTIVDAPAASRTRNTLIAQLQARRKVTTDLQRQADQLRTEVSALRERELGGAAVAQLLNLEAATGLAPVHGSGAKITLRDGPTTINPVTGERRTDAQVKDSDLQLASNALWSAGAEAIAINGQRLTATSTIRQAGEAILVDFHPVSTPYEVVAIGPNSLADDFTNGYAGRFFRELVARYGMAFDAAAVDDVTLGAATDLTLRVARPYAPTPASSSSGSASAQPKTSRSEGGR